MYQIKYYTLLFDSRVKDFQDCLKIIVLLPFFKICLYSTAQIKRIEIKVRMRSSYKRYRIAKYH